MQLGNEGGHVLLDALSDNRSLRHLAYLSSGHNSDLLATAGRALAKNSTLQCLSLQHDHGMLGMMWDGQGENPVRRYWRGQIVDRVAFARALEQADHTLLTCDVFDGQTMRQQIGFTQTEAQFMEAHRPEIPQGLAVLQRNQAGAGAAYVDTAIKFRAQAKSLQY